MKTRMLLKPEQGEESWVQLDGQKMFAGVYTDVQKPQYIHFTGEGFLRLVQGDHVMIEVIENKSIAELRTLKDRIA